MDKAIDAAKDVSLAYIDYLYYATTAKTLAMTIVVCSLMSLLAYVIKKASE